MKKERYFEATEFENIKEIIYNSAEKYGENTAFILKHKKDKEVEYENISYKRLLKEINYLGTKLFDLGYQNKRIAIVGRNRYEWVLTHLANLLGGMVSIPLDKELQVDELESCIKRSRADIVVFDEKYIDNIEKIKERNNTYVQEYICMSKQDNYIDIETLKKEGKELLDKGNQNYINKEIDSYKMNILLFTSGTTSKSKAVMLSQNNIASNVYAMQLVENYETDVNLAFLPFHHIFGSTEMIVMLACGLATAFPDGLRYVAQNLKEYKVSVFVGVPLLIEAIYKKIEQGIEKQGKAKLVNSTIKLSNFLLKVFHIDIRRKLFKTILNELGGHMRFIISGGAPLDKKVAKRFNELGIDLVQGYGLTETSPVIAAENYKKVKYGSIGVPMDNVDIEFENKDENGIGELKVKGPNVMLGYYENPEATKEVLKNGWFYTGDLAKIDSEGYIFICGRRKSVIVLKNGKNIFPEEIEGLINQIDGVIESFIFGKQMSEDKNDIKIYSKIVYDKATMKEKYQAEGEKEINSILNDKIKAINNKMPRYKAIRGIIVSQEPLIKTTTNKIKRHENLKLIKEEK